MLHNNNDQDDHDEVHEDGEATESIGLTTSLSTTLPIDIPPQGDMTISPNNMMDLSQMAQVFDRPLDQNLNNLFERIHGEILALRIEDNEYAQALLASRAEYDELDALEKRNNIVLSHESCAYSSIKIKNKRQERCSICMDRYSCNQQVYRLPCNHLLHKKCLDEWVLYKSECPVCRRTLDEIS